MAKKKTKSPGMLTGSREARHDYNVEGTVEVDVMLQGTEVKSIRCGSANLKDGYAQVKRGEMYVSNTHIIPYEEESRFNHDPLRSRKLLLHKKEIIKLDGRIRETGYSIIPLKLYLKHGRCKVLLSIAHGRKLYDKRQALKDKTMKRDVDCAVKARY